MKNRGFATATNGLGQVFLGNSFISTKPNEVDYFFNHIFVIDGLVEKNTFVLMYFQDLVTRKKFQEIKRIISDNTLDHFHPSCLFTMMLMTKTVQDLQESYTRLDKLYTQISANY
jgi:hypothetical protein